MKHINETAKGAAAFSIIAAIVLAAVTILFIVGVSAVAIFAVAFPTLLLLRPLIRRFALWLDVKATNKLIELSKRRSQSA